MPATIGIKIANGEFYSIVEENSSVKKRLILTTVRDKQRSVQIDLYKSYAKTMADALYIGTLKVENINLRPKGEPSVELIISSYTDGHISADAIDMDPAGEKEHHYLDVSLGSLDMENKYEVEDFELDDDEHPPVGLYEKVRTNERRPGFFWFMVATVMILLAVFGFVFWFFSSRRNPSSLIQVSGSQESAVNPVSQARDAGSQETSSVPEPVLSPAPASSPVSAEAGAVSQPAPAPSQPPAVPALQPLPGTPAETPRVQPPVIQPVTQAPAVSGAPRRTRPVPPVASYRVPENIPREGVPYRVGNGDTLWDIAQAFYRNPWLYPRIATFNNIRNPDRILSGTVIRIPPRN